MAKRHRGYGPSPQYRYEHYDPCGQGLPAQ